MTEFCSLETLGKASPYRRDAALAKGYLSANQGRMIKKNDKTDDILLRIRAEFEAHNCQQDAGQSAARIVREATQKE
ncbi:MAG: hypothetical protein WBV36_25605 [Terriglobales bacterium]